MHRTRYGTLRRGLWGCDNRTGRITQCRSRSTNGHRVLEVWYDRYYNKKTTLLGMCIVYRSEGRYSPQSNDARVCDNNEDENAENEK